MKRMTIVGVAVLFALVAGACNYTNWEEGGIHRDWWCDPTDIEVNDGHGGGHHGGHHFPYTEEKGPLSGEHCFNLDFQFTVASNYAALFPTKAIAEANGWFWIAPAIPGQGTHHSSPTESIGAGFNPLRPNLLMYDGNGPDAPLSGMAWAVFSPGAPPAGFDGDNDHWHAHQALCFNSAGFIIGDGLTDEECEAIGGAFNLAAGNIWLVHVWLPVYDGWYADDIFNKEHPGVVGPF